MKSFSVVENLDVIKDQFTDGGCRHVPGAINFGFEYSEEGLSDSIVETVTFLAHALAELLPPQKTPEFNAGVLDSSIGMNQRPRARMTS